MKRAFRTLSSDSSKSPSGSPPAKRTAPKVGSRRPSAEAPKTPEASPSKKESLSIANVANIFIKMRRASDQVKTKPWHIDSSSGEAPQSHPGVLEAAMSDQRKALNHKATFICSGAVNVGHLLRLSRKQLVEIAEEIGANALVDERCVRVHGISYFLLTRHAIGGIARSVAQNIVPMERSRSM